MVKFLTPGKVVILTKGKYAGRKAVVVKTYDNASGNRKFPHAIVVGINKTPKPVTKSMSRRKVLSRTRVLPFIKVINYNHLMPTRYALEGFDASKIVTPEAVADKAKKAKATHKIRPALQQRFNSGQHKWFFSRLSF